MLGGDAGGMIVNRPEVEVGTEAGEIAGIGRWVNTFALDDRQAEREGVGREGGVNVQVAEQYLFGRRAGHTEGLTCLGLCRRARGHNLFGQSRLARFSRTDVLAAASGKTERKAEVHQYAWGRYPDCSHAMMLLAACSRFQAGSPKAASEALARL